MTKEYVEKQYNELIKNVNARNFHDFNNILRQLVRGRNLGCYESIRSFDEFLPFAKVRQKVSKDGEQEYTKDLFDIIIDTIKKFVDKKKDSKEFAQKNKNAYKYINDINNILINNDLNEQEKFFNLLELSFIEIKNGENVAAFGAIFLALGIIFSIVDIQTIFMALVVPLAFNPVISIVILSTLAICFLSFGAFYLIKSSYDGKGNSDSAFYLAKKMQEILLQENEVNGPERQTTPTSPLQKRKYCF